MARAQTVENQTSGDMDTLGEQQLRELISDAIPDEAGLAPLSGFKLTLSASPGFQKAFFSARCDCGDQLDKAMHAIVEEGTGLLIYLRQEGRGIGLINKIRAYRLQDRGLDTVDANEHLGFAPDPRVYTAAAEIVAALQVHSIRLLTNNPKKMAGLANCGVHITERIPLLVPAKAHNEFYLQTKRDRLGHLL